MSRKNVLPPSAHALTYAILKFEGSLKEVRLISATYLTYNVTLTVL